MSEPSSRAAQLKKEGNGLFAQKKYGQAATKFTKAIELDDKNAILFANRAACHLHLKQYLAAQDDARKAIDIDPKYAKAHARLATAHATVYEWPPAVSAWKDALACLPASNLSTAEQNQKDQYQRALENAERENAKGDVVCKPPTVHKDKVLGEMPWDCGRRMMPTLLGMGDLKGSAWLICNAREQYERGLSIMDEGRIVLGPNGQPMFHGRFGAIEALTNGLIRDIRAFSLDSDPNAWIRKYNQQVELEITMTKPWVKGKPADVFREAPIRVKKEGWESTRNAIVTTIRAWIMRAILESGLYRRKEIALEMLGWAIEVLAWGNRVWKDIPLEQKGAIFDEFFIIGVKSLYATTVMEAIGSGMASEKCNLEALYEDVDEIIKLLEDVALQGTQIAPEPGFAAAFYVYPLATAYALKGFYLGNSVKRENDAAVREAIYKQTALAYRAAAGCLPDDEEQKLWYLQTASGYMSKQRATVDEHVEVMEKMRLIRPKVNAIWKNSSLALGGRDRKLDEFEKVEKDLREKLKKDPSAGDTRMTIGFL